MMIILYMMMGSNIAMLGGGDGVETGVKRLEVTVFSESVFAGIKGALCLGLQKDLGLATNWLLVQEAILVCSF